MQTSTTTSDLVVLLLLLAGCDQRAAVKEKYCYYAGTVKKLIAIYDSEGDARLPASEQMVEIALAYTKISRPEHDASGFENQLWDQAAKLQEAIDGESRRVIANPVKRKLEVFEAVSMQSRHFLAVYEGRRAN